MNTFKNLINTGASGILDTTFDNIETAIGMTKDYAQEKIDEKKNQEATVQAIKDAGGSMIDVGKYLGEEKEKAINEAKYGKQPTEEELLEQTLQWAEEQQNKEWERENAIRKETQEREDSALQRWVADAQKAGINANLFSGQGAASGGGITSATGLNMSQYETTANKLLEEWKTMVEQDFERNENRKDRYNKIMTGLLNLAGLGFFAKGRKK